jgi:hypothetical protein
MASTDMRMGALPTLRWNDCAAPLTRVGQQ